MNQSEIIQKIYEVSYQAAHNYFSDQLIIFSVIVATMVGLQFYWSYRISKNKIKEEIDKQVKQVEKRLFEEYKKKVDFLVEVASASERKLSNQMQSLQAGIYRTMGHFFDSEKSYRVSFVWWIRAAGIYVSVDDEKLARIALNNATNSLENIKYSYEINDHIGEYQNIISSIDDSKYGIEKSVLNEAVKKILQNKFSTKS